MSSSTKKILYHAKRGIEMLKKVINQVESGPSVESSCEQEQIVKDAAVIAKQEACDVVDLACADLDNCLGT